MPVSRLSVGLPDDAVMAVSGEAEWVRPGDVRDLLEYPWPVSKAAPSEVSVPDGESVDVGVPVVANEPHVGFTGTLTVLVTPRKPDTEGSGCKADGSMSAECARFRIRVVNAMKTLIAKDPQVDLTQQRVAEAMSLAPDSLRELSSKHKKCCGFNWIRDVRNRGLLTGE